MLEEFRELFSGGYKNCFNGCKDFNDGLNQLFRDLHTFKGDFAQYGFFSASEKLHEFEDALLKFVNSPRTSIVDVEEIMAHGEPEKILEDDLKIIYEVLGKSYFSQSEMISIPKSKLIEIENKIKNQNSLLNSSDLILMVEELRKKNIKVLMEQYSDYLQYLANRLMKSVPIYIIDGEDVLVDPERYGSFIKSLVHIFRNIMDHGIETEEERLEQGKEIRGLVECRISKLDEEWFTITISDDGRGIDIDKVKERAIANNLYKGEEVEEFTEREICNLILADHFSTKACTDEISGRGVGMSAFKEACTSLGGRVEVLTEKNKGTSFHIKLPFFLDT